MRNPQPFLVCLFFLFPLATSFFIVDQQPEEESNDYNDAEEKRGGSWQNSNMFRASKRMNFRATKRSSAEPDDFTTDNLLAGENDEKRGSWRNSNMFRASKRMNFRATKRNTIDPDGIREDSFLIMFPQKNSDLSNAEKRGGSWRNSNMFRSSKRMNFRATKRSPAAAVPDTEDLQAWKRMSFRATKRAPEFALAPEQEEEEEEDNDDGMERSVKRRERRAENLIRVLRRQNSRGLKTVERVARDNYLHYT